MKKKLFVIWVIMGIYSSILAQESINQLDKNGKFHGKYKKLYSNGNLRYEGQFEHGKEVGIFKFYAITGEKHPIATKEYSTGNDSINVFFYGLSGKMESKGKMIDKNRVGEWQFYFPDGKTLMSIEQYKDNLLDGEVKIYYKSGTLTEVSNYKKGKLHGNRKRFDEDGKIVEDINYQEGITHGPAIFYNEKGEESAKGNYENGLKTGEWQFKIDGEWINSSNPDKVVIKK